MAGFKQGMQDAIQREREVANQNATAAITSLKQARLDLQRLFEEEEEVMKENKYLLIKLDSYEQHKGKGPQKV
jgi:capsule polysaccharide export protein KpsE/RkpR